MIIRGFIAGAMMVLMAVCVWLLIVERPGHRKAQLAVAPAPLKQNGAVTVSGTAPIPQDPEPMSEKEMLACDRSARTSDYFTAAEVSKRDALVKKIEEKDELINLSAMPDGAIGYTSDYIESYGGKLYANDFKYVSLSPGKRDNLGSELNIRIIRRGHGILIDCDIPITIYHSDDPSVLSYMPVLGQIAKAKK